MRPWRKTRKVIGANMKTSFVIYSSNRSSVYVVDVSWQGQGFPRISSPLQSRSIVEHPHRRSLARLALQLHVWVVALYWALWLNRIIYFLTTNVFHLLCRLFMHVRNDFVLGLSYRGRRAVTFLWWCLHGWSIRPGRFSTPMDGGVTYG